MRLSILKFVIVTAVLVVVASSTSRADGCPTSPSYSTDFSTNQSCLTLNGTPTKSGYPGFFPAVPPTMTTVLRLTPNATSTSGSAWFSTQQSVAGTFSTTFTFQLSGASQGSLGNADGFAFVIQNSALTALGPAGCGMGYGDSSTGCAPAVGGIPASLAVEFDTYQNADDPNNNHVAIQSCGANPNSIDNESGGVPAACNLALNSNLPVTLADGKIHTVVISYSGPSTTLLDVMIDGHDLFSGGVTINLDTLLSLTSGNAWVGFTAATGGGDDKQDILTWTFTPQSQSGTVSTGTTTTLPFLNDAYNFEAQLNSGSSTTVTVKPIYMTVAACNALVQETYPGAQCFVYGGLAPNPDSAVLLEVTCPAMNNAQCNPFDAQLATNFNLSTASGVNQFNPLDPFPGFLKGDGGVDGDPCMPPAPPGKLFKSNQIDLFTLTRTDPRTHAGSGGTGSCWAATFNQPDEVIPGITISSPTNTSYAQGQPVAAAYTCSNPATSKLPEASSPVGPYLSTTSCTQATGSGGSCSQTTGGLVCTGTVDTSTVGTQPFQVTAMDSGTNTSTQSVNYTVVGPTSLQIANIASIGTAPTGTKFMYDIGVADFGPANAVGVVVTDPLPSNTKFVSASGVNVSCSVVSGKLICTSTPVVCSLTGNTVSCNVGTLAPLSLSPLNYATMHIKVKVTGQPATLCNDTPCTIDTATVSEINTNTSANSSSTVQVMW